MVSKAIFLMGPTAAGKTDLALRLAEFYPIEIISVDSALIYQGLDIGSAKPSPDELTRVPHHLINIISPLENYSVADFITDSNRLIAEVNQRGNLPLLVGGTMMYYSALISGLSALPNADKTLRESLEREFAINGNQAMHEQLQVLDPYSAARIAVNDSQRLQRALEVCLLTGRPMSEVQKDQRLPGLVNCNYLSLAILPENRQLLHNRINQRFSKMLDSGFIAEVQHLQSCYPELSPEHNSMRCVGYRQVWEYLAGNISYTQLQEQGQAATRQLAKRQITWLRSIPSLHIDDYELNQDILLNKILVQIDEFVNTKKL